MPQIYHHQFTVPQEAIDENGHVNNVVYVQWMQDVAILHSDAQNCNSVLYKKLGACWVARSHYIEYHSPAFAGDQVDAITWVSDLKRSSSLRKYRFVRTSDQKVLARAETRWVYVNEKTGRPCTIHDEVMASFVAVPSEEEP